MKVAIITAVVLAAASLIIAIRGGMDLPIVQALPFCGGERPMLYEWGGCSLLVITGWGLVRLYRLRQDDE